MDEVLGKYIRERANEWYEKEYPHNVHDITYRELAAFKAGFMIGLYESPPPKPNFDNVLKFERRGIVS